MWLYRSMAKIGYTPPVVREMELWECAAMMGDESHDPVIVGSRGLVLPSDDRKGPSLPSGMSGTRFKSLGDNLAARVEAAKKRQAPEAGG